eukprot:TRINITY_DN18364_c0_g1_i1.p1 TRINITY_DN18364_c0_g1~~TRINITY_DN18364_c0_g1_i1.p1  ORF type:complete len:257 (-),score=17.08 TRINITY_DN18364_c0_g1_i1:56-826(-)
MADERRAAGAGIRQVWDDLPLSEGRAPTVQLPAPNRSRQPADPAVRKPAPVVEPLRPEQRLPSRSTLRARGVGHVAPHAEAHLPGYGGHQPGGWDIAEFNSAHLARAAADEAAGRTCRTPPQRPEPETFRPSRRRFEVADSFTKTSTEEFQTSSRKQGPLYQLASRKSLVAPLEPSPARTGAAFSQPSPFRLQQDAAMILSESIPQFRSGSLAASISTSPKRIKHGIRGFQGHRPSHLKGVTHSHDSNNAVARSFG